MWNTTKDPVARPASRNLNPQKIRNFQIYGSRELLVSKYME
jgi:hypothetical protein